MQPVDRLLVYKKSQRISIGSSFMKNTKIIIAVCIYYCLCFGFCFAIEDNNKQPDCTPQTWAVIVSGINKDLEEQQVKADAVFDLVYYLTEELGLDNKHIKTLVAKDSPVAPHNTIESSLENLKKTMAEMSESVNNQDSFILYYVGQANVVNKKLRFNLPGKDICHDEFAELVDEIESEKMLIVADCPGAGLAVGTLADPNRIVIGAAGVDQPFSTTFSGYFIPAMFDPASDFNSDGNVTVLEAFKKASILQDEYYNTEDRVKIENPLLEDDGDGIPSQNPWTYKQNGNDGKFSDTWIVAKVRENEKSSEFSGDMIYEQDYRQ